MSHHPIDPKIDCVFKALLGSEANRALLIHFLNANLGAALPAPITEVEILNPYNDREFLDDKLSIVDVKARDQHGSLHQIEIQLLTNRDLLARILYTWADLYSSQLQSGQDYSTLKPTYAIWLLGEDLLPKRPEYAHDFRLRDTLGRPLLDHGGIWLLELNKFHTNIVYTEQQRWLKFFAEGEHLDPEALPAWMHTNEMRQAMSTLQAFSDKDRAYHAYQARQNYLREQRGIQRHLEELQTETEQQRAALEQQRAALEQVRAEKEQAQAREEQAQAEKEQAQAREEQERAAKEAALAELARLKAQLNGQNHTN
ncbi:Rpn family recombination-promoting nuclease/putative transposase [Allochromatium humboldtianum]|jgi:predicted transposase/invertase (TIGR01784 family)|uniref:Rpn family recombination-promoting nuclease/putative transposase n=1 Tax=Allochromatium humboldtianum TaxID=504901 RepID=A0A850R9K6_9GAMM|nr:Rpn family recombination-promoting nuclease/putative transposase [Allochromatium humboldtianum]NVZ07650.1 Rpn family recombination-promoting nuclease/putative transposase [Allochromatium humboldtianum]